MSDGVSILNYTQNNFLLKKINGLLQSQWDEVSLVEGGCVASVVGGFLDYGT